MLKNDSCKFLWPCNIAISMVGYTLAVLCFVPEKRKLFSRYLPDVGRTESRCRSKLALQCLVVPSIFVLKKKIFLLKCCSQFNSEITVFRKFPDFRIFCKKFVFQEFQSCTKEQGSNTFKKFLRILGNFDQNDWHLWLCICCRIFQYFQLVLLLPHIFIFFFKTGY